VLKIDPRIQATRKCGSVMSWLDLLLRSKALKVQRAQVV